MDMTDDKMESLLIEVKASLAVNENEMRNVKVAVESLKDKIDGMEQKLDEFQTFRTQYDSNIKWLQKVTAVLVVLFAGGCLTGFQGKSEVLSSILAVFAH